MFTYYRERSSRKSKFKIQKRGKILISLRKEGKASKALALNRKLIDYL